MKKLLISVLIMSFLVCSIFAIDQKQASRSKYSAVKLDASVNKMPTKSREFPTPEYAFVIEPTEIMTSFYDYMPGSYSGKPLRIHTNPNGGLTIDDVEHIYMAFHQTATITAERYISYAYLDDGSLSYDRVSGNSIREGYPGITIDPETGDPFVVFHHEWVDANMLDVGFTYDLNHFIGGAGYWADPVNAIDNHNHGSWAAHDDDEFIWPNVFVSKAPSYEEDGKRRVYVFAQNSADHNGNLNDENEAYAYADFTTSDLESLTPLNWTHQLVPQMAHYTNDLGYRAYHVINVTWDGTIMIYGYFHPEEGIENDDEEAFVLYNDDFGNVDDWEEKIMYNSEKYVEGPLNQDGTNGLTITEPYFYNYFASHMGCVIDSDGVFHYAIPYALGGTSVDDGSDVYIQHRFFMKSLAYDPALDVLHYQDLYPKGAEPHDDSPYLPWDEDENGEVDEFTDEGNSTMALGWPIYWHTADVNAWSEANFKMSYNEETGWMAAVWNDGLANAIVREYDGEEVQWDGVPEIYICMSYNNGKSWSEPIMLNSVETPELDGVIPEYIYPADKLLQVDDDTHRLYIMFYDDNDFGSTLTDNTLPRTGGKVSYMAIDIDYCEVPENEYWDGGVDTDDNTVENVTSSLKLANYPNPFNPTTTISFDVPEAAKGSLEIYNVRGQLVRTLAEGNFAQKDNTFTWNGKDDNNNDVTSGIYFYKVKAGSYQATNKMILMK